MAQGAVNFLIKTLHIPGFVGQTLWRSRFVRGLIVHCYVRRLKSVTPSLTMIRYRYVKWELEDTTGVNGLYLTHKR